jgi:23S rRNA (guanosine2251-2'-O)-methyltransferase
MKRLESGFESGFDVEIIAGRNPVHEALKAGRPLNKILIHRGDREGTIRVIEAMALERGIVVQSVDKAKLTGLAGSAHQGVVAYASIKEYCQPDDIVSYASECPGNPLIVMAYEVSDPRNLGSIIRSSEAAGAHGVIIPKRRSAGLTPAVSKASAGAIEYMRVARITNTSDTLRQMKKQGLWIIGADAEWDKLYTECDLTIPAVLVVGVEDKGLGRIVRETCDLIVRLPMMGKINSLNVSVAASILLYETVRQRGAGT